MCQCHGSRFDIAHRRRDQRPGDRRPLHVYEVQEVDGEHSNPRLKDQPRPMGRAVTAKGTKTDEQGEQTRLALRAMLIPIFFVAMFALCIIGTYHKPHPNDIKVAVVGPAAQTAPLRAGLEKEGGSAFDISQVATAAEATHDVRQRDLNAAFVPARGSEATRHRDRRQRRRPHRRDRRRDASPAPSPRPRERSSSCAMSGLSRPETRSGSASSCS